MQFVIVLRAFVGECNCLKCSNKALVTDTVAYKKKIKFGLINKI